MSLKSRIENLERDPIYNKGYDMRYLIEVKPDGSPFDAEARARLADALDARAAGYRVCIEKRTKPNFTGNPWKGLDERLARYTGGGLQVDSPKPATKKSRTVANSRQQSGNSQKTVGGK